MKFIKGAGKNKENSHKHHHESDGLSAKDAGEMGFHREFHDLDGPVCSSMDCTGLIPAPPQSDAEEEAYEELYPFLPEAAVSKDEDSFT
ncbi:MAG: hypothetical protein HFG49_08565 [Lachnospiraceae bacterium]|jgi:hypothetical protein|nr:hypothetical protein [Lachnospiraceae bacterium]